MTRHTSEWARSVLAVSLVVLAQNAMAAVVGVEDQEVAVGIARVITKPVRLLLDQGEQVAGCQFDLEFNPEVFTLTSLVAGTVATTAAKTVSYSEMEHGKVRVIIQGLNLNAMNSGTMAQATFVIEGGTSQGDYPIAIKNLVCSDPYGLAVPSVAQSALITVTEIPVPTAGIAALIVTVAGCVMAAVKKRKFGCCSGQ